MIRLKILSGPQAGAVESLGPGKWLLGSGEHCDLVLRDSGIYPEQLTLVVSPLLAEVTVIASAEVAAPNLGQQPDGETNWFAGEILMLAGTSLVWELESTAGHSRPTLPGNAGEPAKYFAACAKWAVGTFAAVLIAVVLAAQANWANADPQGGPHQSVQPKVMLSAEAMTSELLAQGFAEVSVQRTKAGATAVVGWVRDRAELARLRQSLGGSEVQENIIQVDEQIRFAREYLLLDGLTVTVRYQGDGVLLIETSGNDESGFRERVQGLHKAAPMVRHFEVDYRVIDYRVMSPQAVVAVPEDRVKSAGRRQLIAGIDGISLFGLTRFLTSGTHYVFEGGVLRDGTSILQISTDLVVTTPDHKIDEETRDDISRTR